MQPTQEQRPTWSDLMTLLDRSGEPVTVRDARPGDAEAIAAIGRVGFPAVHSPAVAEPIVRAAVERVYDVGAVQDCIAACAASPHREFLVAEAGDRVIGYVHYEADRPEPELMRIYLDQARIGSGAGTLLLEALEARLAPGTSYLLLVLGNNERARRFYARRGFVEEREVDGPRFFAEHMGIELPAGEYAPAYVMRRVVPG